MEYPHSFIDLASERIGQGQPGPSQVEVLRHIKYEPPSRFLSIVCCPVWLQVAQFIVVIVSIGKYPTVHFELQAQSILPGSILPVLTDMDE